MYVILCVNFVAHELLLFNHSYLAVLTVVLIVISMSFLFFFFFCSFQTNVCQGLASRLCNKTPWANLLAYSLHTTHFFFFFLHFSRSSSYSYFFRSWASSTCSSHGTVNSHINIFFILFENISITGRNDIWAIWSGNFNLVSKSVHSSPMLVTEPNVVWLRVTVLVVAVVFLTTTLASDCLLCQVLPCPRCVWKIHERGGLIQFRQIFFWWPGNMGG